MKRFWIAVLAAGIALSAVSALQYLMRPKAGDPAPDFRLPSIHSGEVSLSGYEGRPVILHFWASWCPPCLEEFPSLVELERDFRDRGLVVLAVSQDEDPEAAAAFARGAGAGFPVLLDSEMHVTDAYLNRYVPETIFIDDRGVIVERHAGPLDWGSQEVRRRVDNFVRGKG